MKPKVGNAAKQDDDDDTILLHSHESFEVTLVLLVLYGCLGLWKGSCKHKLYFAQSHNPRWM